MRFRLLEELSLKFLDASFVGSYAEWSSSKHPLHPFDRILQPPPLEVRLPIAGVSL